MTSGRYLLWHAFFHQDADTIMFTKILRTMNILGLKHYQIAGFKFIVLAAYLQKTCFLTQDDFNGIGAGIGDNRTAKASVYQVLQGFDRADRHMQSPVTFNQGIRIYIYRCHCSGWLFCRTLSDVAGKVLFTPCEEGFFVSLSLVRLLEFFEGQLMRLPAKCLTDQQIRMINIMAMAKASYGNNRKRMVGSCWTGGVTEV